MSLSLALPRGHDVPCSREIVLSSAVGVVSQVARDIGRSPELGNSESVGFPWRRRQTHFAIGRVHHAAASKVQGIQVPQLHVGSIVCVHLSCT